MTRMLVRALAATGLALMTPWAAAIDCGKDEFKLARTLSDLPVAVRERVLQKGAVANPGERWMVGDVVEKEDRGLPVRLLSGAAVGQHHAFVAIVIGGGPWLFEGWRFERGDGDWRGGQVDLQRPVGGSPLTLAQLLYAFCDGYPKPFLGNPDLVSGVVTSQGRVILTVDDAAGSVGYRLDRGRRGIRFLQSGRPLNAFARAALRDRLLQAQAVMPSTDATYPLVAEYLKALDADSSAQPSR